MSSLIDDLKSLKPKHPLIQHKWWSTDAEGYLTGTCPLTALALDKGLLVEYDIHNSGLVHGGHIIDIMRGVYGDYVRDVYLIWDKLEDPTLKKLVEALEYEE